MNCGTTYDCDRHELKAEIDRLRADNATSRRENEEFRSEYGELEVKFENCEADNAALKARITELDADLQGREAVADSYAAENQQLHDRAEKAEADCKRAEADAAAADRCMRDYNRRLISAEAERDALRALLMDTLPDLKLAANRHRDARLLDRVLAALNPPPAGREG